MKILEAIGNWTRRQLWWLLPFIVIMPLVLIWWNRNIDEIGHWLWTQWHSYPVEFVVGMLLCVVTLAGFAFLANHTHKLWTGK